jgi:hypothetical protein
VVLGTHQDRLIKKMRLKKIASDEAANEYLFGPYGARHNARYAVAAKEAADYRSASATAAGPGASILPGAGA